MATRWTSCAQRRPAEAGRRVVREGLLPTVLPTKCDRANHEVVRTDIKRVREFVDTRKGRLGDPSLDLAHERPIEIGSFRQCILCQLKSISKGRDDRSERDG